MNGLPWSEPVRLHQIGARLERHMAPDETAKARIICSLDLASLSELSADIDIQPAPVGWRLQGRLKARLEQTCGITLEPLPVEIDEAFTVTFAEAGEDEGDEIVVTLDDESPDLIEDGQIDLGQVLVEQLALQLDPFPRKPGVEFEQPEEPAEISPFAALKALKDKGEG